MQKEKEKEKPFAWQNEEIEGKERVSSSYEIKRVSSSHYMVKMKARYHPLVTNKRQTLLAFLAWPVVGLYT